MEKFEFRKVRDFGELINDTFVFVKHTWKPLFNAFFSICGFFIAASMVMAVMQQLKLSDALNQAAGGNPMRVKTVYDTQYFLTILFSFMEYTSISLTALCFMSLYQEKGGEAPTTEEVWSYFKFYFLRFSISNFLLLLLQITGFVFLLIPGFYLMPILSMVLASMVLENATLGYSFGRAFRLIRNHWWQTFGALLIIGLVLYAGILIFSLPSIIITMGSAFLGPDSGVSTVLRVILGVVSHIGMLFYILPWITVGLAFFSLTEEKEGAGLEDRINRLGTKNSRELPAEEY